MPFLSLVFQARYAVIGIGLVISKRILNGMSRLIAVLTRFSLVAFVRFTARVPGVTTDFVSEIIGNRTTATDLTRTHSKAGNKMDADPECINKHQGYDGDYGVEGDGTQ